VWEAIRDDGRETLVFNHPIANNQSNNQSPNRNSQYSIGKYQIDDCHFPISASSGK
jgi:hypothetical protein